MVNDRGRGLAFSSVPLKESPSHQYSIREECDLTISSHYINNTGKTISMSTRSGIIYDLPCKSHRSHEGFIVRQDVYVADNLKHALRNRLVAAGDNIDSDMMDFKKVFMNAYQEQSYGLSFRYDHSISAPEITRQGGSVYVVELDIILSTTRDDIPIHPFCQQAMREDTYNDSDVRESGVGIEIVDNKGVIGSRFVRLMGKVVRVNTCVSPLRRDGVYVRYRDVVDDDSQYESSKFVEYIPPHELDSCQWLYTSYALAKYSPERELELNMDMKELDIKAKRLSSEASLNKHTADLEKIELERRNSLLREQLDENERLNRRYELQMTRGYSEEDHLIKLQQLRQKDYYETRSADRKDSSEWLKAMPTILMGVGAVALAIKSLMK